MEVRIIKSLQDVNGKLCLMESDLYNQLQIEEKTNYKLHVGQLAVTCSLQPCKNEESSLLLPETLLEQLLLYDQAKLNIWKKGADLYLGPVVGMFMPIWHFETIEKGRPIVGAVEHIQEAAPYAGCLGYCFCVRDLDWENKRVKGYMYIQHLNKWEHRWLPMPDVIYDRAAYLDPEEKQMAVDMRELFQEDPNVRFINNGGSLGKWQLFKQLSKYPEVSGYLPETVFFKDTDDVLTLLHKYHFVFLKSSMGSGGKEVLSIEQTGDKYCIDFYQDGLKVVTVNGVEELKRYIERFVDEKKQIGREKFIVQQGLRLIKYNGHPMDFRLHIVKNEEGKWEVAKYYARYARGESKITNYCTGGGCELFDRIYPVFKDMHQNLILPTPEALGETTIKIAGFIEKAFGSYGEIGMDMAIDENGRIWIIEANAKPDKYRTPELDNMNEVAPQALAIFKYAKYLARSRK